MLVFITPLYGLTSLNAPISQQQNNIPGLEAIRLGCDIRNDSWISLIASIFLLWGAGYLLARCFQWKSVRKTILVIWLRDPVSTILTTFYLYWKLPSLFEVAFGGYVTDFFSSLSYPVIWTRNLLHSKRVKNTYRKTNR